MKFITQFVCYCVSVVFLNQEFMHMQTLNVHSSTDNQHPVQPMKQPHKVLYFGVLTDII